MPFRGRMAHPQPLSVTEDTELYERVVSQMRDRMGVDKPRPGVHVSELIYCLLKGWTLRRLDEMPGGRYAPGRVTEPPDEQVFVWVVGHSHEAIFGTGTVRGKSEVKDGIWYTPDFFFPSQEAAEEGALGLDKAWVDSMLTEMKSTRASAKKRMDEGDMVHYLHQLASYLAAEGRTEGWIWVFHIMGDYYHQTTEGKAKGAGPQAKLKLWHIVYDEFTLKRWWEELQARAVVIEDRTVTPAPAPAFEWECGYCPVRELINCPGGAEWQLAQARRGARQQTMENKLQAEDKLSEDE